MKRLLYLMLGGAGTILGLLIMAQVASPKEFSINSPVIELEAKNILINEFIEEQAQLLNKTQQLRRLIAEKQLEISQNTEIYNINFLNDLRDASGFTNVNGEGVEILLDVGSAIRGSGGSIESEGIFASDLRDLVNALKSGNATAISINNQRIVYGSVISNIGNTILINNIHTSPPYTIKAVGDPSSIVYSLQNRYLLSDFYQRVDQNQLRLYVQVVDRIFVPAFNGTLRISNINLVK